METMRPQATTRVLDVGVDDVAFGEDGFAPANFFEVMYPWPHNITAVGLHDAARFSRTHPAVRYVRSDACSLPFGDKEFDVYFSNAVIEHVGDRERQRRFVAEALRVAERVFITTPNRRFPVELHTRLPFVHWLPAAVAARAYERAGKPWAKEIVLLGPGSFRALFPSDAEPRIVNLGMTLVAIASQRA